MIDLKSFSRRRHRRLQVGVVIVHTPIAHSESLDCIYHMYIDRWASSPCPPSWGGAVTRTVATRPTPSFSDTVLIRRRVPRFLPVSNKASVHIPTTPTPTPLHGCSQTGHQASGFMAARPGSSFVSHGCLDAVSSELYLFALPHRIDDKYQEVAGSH